MKGDGIGFLESTGIAYISKNICICKILGLTSNALQLSLQVNEVILFTCLMPDDVIGEFFTEKLVSLSVTH